MKTIKKTIISSALLLLTMTSVSAAWSEIFTVSVPRWGGWSIPSQPVKKVDDSKYAYFNLNTAPHTFALYGDLFENGNRSTETYYKLTLDQNTRMFYNKNKGKNGSEQQGRVSSSNYEFDERRVTFRFNP